MKYMKKFIYIHKLLIFRLLFFFIFSTNGFSTICCDGTFSSSTGKGICSHHGGVCSTTTSTTSTTTCKKPYGPYYISASDGKYEDKIYIDWQAVSNTDYYKIYVKKDNLYSTYTLISSNHYSSEYYYYTNESDKKKFKVVACNSCGCSTGATDTGYIKYNDKIICSNFKVIDGDTLKYNDITYRLYGIDAPESYDGSKMNNDASKCNISEDIIQNAGLLSKDFLVKLLKDNNGECKVEQKYTDSYGRTVALIYLPNGISLNETLISNGYAISWDYYINEDSLNSKWNIKEKTAAENSYGLWDSYCQLMNCLSENSYLCNTNEDLTTTNATTPPLIPSNVIDTIKNSVLTNNSGKYDITGYFAPYTFGGDAKSNWTFTFSSKYGGDTYQLLGDISEENIQKMGIFGWVKKDVIPNDPMFYMVQYEPTPFGWLLFDIDENGNCKNIYKLAGQNPTTKSFSYDVDGDGKIDILDGLNCKVYGDSVEFYSNTLPGM